MRTTPRWLVALLAVLVLAAACGQDQDDDDASTNEPTAEAEGEGDDDTSPDAGTADTGTPDTSSEADRDDGNIVAVVAAADELMASLSDEQLDTLVYDFGDSTIASNWSNLPACDSGGRAGIRHGDLSDDQVASVLAVVASVLSDEGYQEYVEIIAADDYLGSNANGGATVWDADCYYLAFYGEPSESEPWGLQFGGHHYARTFVFEGGTTTATPAFTGVEPSSFELDGATVEPLEDEVSSIFTIFAALDNDALARAEIDGVFDDVLLGPGDDAFPATEGLAVAELDAEAQSLVLAAVRSWVDDSTPSVADELMATVEAELSETSIGWASSIDPETQGSYARIDGPSIWIELVNQAGVGGVEIHHHSVHRDKAGDYGSAA